MDSESFVVYQNMYCSSKYRFVFSVGKISIALPHQTFCSKCQGALHKARWERMYVDQYTFVVCPWMGLLHAFGVQKPACYWVSLKCFIWLTDQTIPSNAKPGPCHRRLPRAPQLQSQRHSLCSSGVHRASCISPFSSEAGSSFIWGRLALYASTHPFRLRAFQPLIS